MVGISIEEFVKKYVKNNPDDGFTEGVNLFKNAVKRKKAGATCTYCGASIWAVGSAISGFDGCFTCITGEHDDSEDYEVY